MLDIHQQSTRADCTYVHIPYTAVFRLLVLLNYISSDHYHFIEFHTHAHCVIGFRVFTCTCMCPSIQLSCLAEFATTRSHVSPSTMEQHNFGASNSSYLTTISGTNVTVQALPVTVNCPVSAGSQMAPTPRSSGQVLRTSVPSRCLISKVLIKCASKENKKQSKTFSLRNVDSAAVTSCLRLKSLIKAQLKDDIRKDFDVGYQHNNSIVSIRSSDDVLEVWSNIRLGKNIILWCDGLKTSDDAPQNKRPASFTGESDDDDDSDVTGKKSTTSKPRKKKKKNDEAVEPIVQKLKDLHRESGFTPMQFRIWAEMHNGGLHPSLDEPPTTTMFARAGGGQATKKKHTQESVTTSDTLSQAITQLAAALSPSVTPSSSHTGRGSMLGTSPAKLIDNRTKCYKQLSELNNLKQSGLLSKEEYHAEREAVMEILKKLNA